MLMSFSEYVMQSKIVKETVQILSVKIRNVKLQLEANPHDANLRRELRELTLDMTITLNELELTEKALRSFYGKNDSQKVAHY